MARAALGWSLSDLAKAASANKRTIVRHEGGIPIMRSNVEKLRVILEAAGVVFIERGVHLGGVVPPRAAIASKKAPSQSRAPFA